MLTASKRTKQTRVCQSKLQILDICLHHSDLSKIRINLCLMTGHVLFIFSIFEMKGITITVENQENNKTFEK